MWGLQGVGSESSRGLLQYIGVAVTEGTGEAKSGTSHGLLTVTPNNCKDGTILSILPWLPNLAYWLNNYIAWICAYYSIRAMQGGGSNVRAEFELRV